MYWLEQTEADVPATDDWFGPAEAVRLSSLRFAKRRSDWRLGRWTAKLAVSAYLQLPATPASLSNIEILAAESGAPEVSISGNSSPVNISISHREGLAMCALAMAPVLIGCDVEFIEPRTDGFIADYFTSEEQTLVSRCEESERATMIALFWSAKESALKVLKEGLRLDTRSIQVRTIPTAVEDWFRLHACCEDGRVFEGWWRSDDRTVRSILADHRLNPPTRLELPFPSQVRL